MDNRKLVKKGRYGDTHIRDVYGLKSHVNKDEAKLIDSYGSLGEAMVKEIGAGTINPNTGFPEYHYNSLHGKSKYIGGHTHDPDPAEVALQEKTQRELEELNLETTPIGKLEDYGMESLTAEEFLGKSPEEAYQYILNTKYGGRLPTVEGKSEAEVELEIRNLLKTVSPKLGQPISEQVGFVAEQYGGAVPDDPSTLDIDESQEISFAESLSGRTAGLTKGRAMSTLQGQAGQVRGAGMRAGIAGQEAIGKGFQTSQDVYALAGETAEMGYRKGIYGLEEKAETKWERDFSTFLNSLPPAIG